MIQTVPDENAPEEIKEETKSAPVSTGEIALGISSLSRDRRLRLCRCRLRPKPSLAPGTIGFVSLILFNLILLVYALTVCKRRGSGRSFALSPRDGPLDDSLRDIDRLRHQPPGRDDPYGDGEDLKPKVRDARLFGAGDLRAEQPPLRYHDRDRLHRHSDLGRDLLSGFLYNALKTRLPLLFAANLQAILFAAAHGAGFMIGILYFIAGMALAVVYEMRKELVSPILVHGAINAMALMPLLALALQNFHMPAATWEEAERPPAWLASAPPAWIDKKENAAAQRQYAIDTWGAKGPKRGRKRPSRCRRSASGFPKIARRAPRRRAAWLRSTPPF